MAATTPENAPEIGGMRATEQSRLSNLAMLIAVSIFATGFPQPGVLGDLAFKHVLVHELKGNATTISCFAFWATIPWFFKPVAGLVSDAFPLLRTRRSAYLLASLVLAAMSWIALAFVPHQFNSLVAACLVVNIFMMIGSTVTGGILVETGRMTSATGRLTSIRVLTQNFITLISGPVGGMIAAAGLGLLSGISSAILFAAVPIVYLLFRKGSDRADFDSRSHGALAQIKKVMADKNVLLSLLVMVLFYFAPGFGSVQYIRQHGLFGFSDHSIGYFWGISSALGIACAFCYFFLCRKWNLRTLIIAAIAMNAIGNFAYLLYSKNFSWDAAIEAQNGVLFAFCEVALYDLAARVIPVGCEAMGYGLLIAAQIFCYREADVFGSFLYDHQHLEFWKLVTLNSSATLCVLLVIWFLPGKILSALDGSRSPAADAA